jgi:hypothetical protein
MHRPRYSWLLLTPVLFVLALSATGCGGSEHDVLIRKFFAASGASDVATLGNIATVSFDPSKDGRAQNVSFVSETPQQTRVLNLKELDKTYKEAQAVEVEFSKRMKDYQDKNLDAINRVVKVEQAGKGKPVGKDLEVQAAWTKWRDESSTIQRHVSEARKALQAERKVADLSVPDSDAATYDATELTTDVTVTANVRSADNVTTKKTLTLTLQRVVLKDTAGKIIEGKWMITSIKEAPAAK